MRKSRHTNSFPKFIVVLFSLSALGLIFGSVTLFVLRLFSASCVFLLVPSFILTCISGLLLLLQYYRVGKIKLTTVGLAISLISCALLTTALFHRNIFKINYYFVPSESMSPTIQVGNILLADTSYKAIINLDVGDVITYRQHDTIYVKRISELKDKHLLVVGDSKTSIPSSRLPPVPKNQVLGVVRVIIGDYKEGKFVFKIRFLE